MNIKVSVCNIFPIEESNRFGIRVGDYKQLEVGNLKGQREPRSIQNEKDRASVIKAMEHNSKQTNQVPNPNTIRRPEEKEPEEDKSYVKNHEDDMII